MDETLNTEVTEEQALAQESAPAAETPAAEPQAAPAAEEQSAPAGDGVTADAAPVQQPAAGETAASGTEDTAPAAGGDEEKTAAPAPQPKTKAEVVERLREIVHNGGEVERAELDHLKALYYRLHNAAAQDARDKFVADGGAPEDFVPAPDTEEEGFKAQLSLIRELRTKAAEALEKEKAENLRRKQEIIERIKEMSVSPEEADKGYDELKKLQAEWKEIKNVPAENATELWKNYQLYVEQYYDQLRLNHEMRAYDFKKNLEAKTRLCEAAEKLAEVEDPVSAFHQLQSLHQEYRETGPVAKELREEVWKRFKDASTVVNKRHQEHFLAQKAQEEDNLRRKTELCQAVEALDFDALKNYAQWDEMAKKVIALQAEWKTIGFTPRKVNAEIFERFRVGCDRFFHAKTAFFKAMREKFSANYEAKMELVKQAEALKDSTDWAATTAKLVQLQKDWKAVGPVAHKVSDAIWKRFNEACNAFFDKKNEATSGERKEQEENLEKKNAILDELAKIAETPADNQLQAVRDLQTRWNEVGHVPFRKKEKMYKRYRALCDKIYDALHESGQRRRMDDFRRSTAEKGGTELTRERARLQNAYEAKKQEIANYETNLGFFSSKSAKGNSLVAEVERKVERLREELATISEKIKTVREQIKAEEQK